jgi:hypothetical protein
MFLITWNVRNVLLKLGPKERRPVEPQCTALAKRVLLTLAEADRDVIARYYVDHQSAEQIERDLGLNAGYVLKLRTAVRSRYFEERENSSVPRAAPW